MFIRYAAVVVMGGGLALGTALAQEQKKPEDAQVSAVGTCAETKQQHQYWCVERESVSVVATGLECENAKRNLAEACGADAAKEIIGE